MQPIIVQDQWWSDTGAPITITYPKRMTPEELQDFKDLLAIIVRKVERWSTPPAEEARPEVVCEQDTMSL